jgi:hypothetical protein
LIKNLEINILFLANEIERKGMKKRIGERGREGKGKKERVDCLQYLLPHNPL